MISSSKLFPPEMRNRRAPPLLQKTQQNKTKQNKTQQQQQCSFKTQICLVFQLLSLADSNLWKQQQCSSKTQIFFMLSQLYLCSLSLFFF
jgi:hypothetical protein